MNQLLRRAFGLVGLSFYGLGFRLQGFRVSGLGVQVGFYGYASRPSIATPAPSTLGTTRICLRTVGRQ